MRFGECQAFVSGCRVALTVREFEILAVLAARPNRVLAREDIYARVWGGRMPHRDRSVDVFVRRVRRKLAQCAPEGTYIHTHFGVGYRLSPVAEGA